MKSGLFDDLIEQPTESPSSSTYKSKSGLFDDVVTYTEQSPVQEVTPITPKVRTITNDDNTIKEGVNIAPTFTKTQKAKMGANLAYNALTEGMWGLPEAMVRSVPSLAEGLTRLSKYTDPNYYLGKITGSKVAEETNRKNLEQAQKFTKLVKENTGFLDEWKQLGEEYRKAEDAGVPEEFRNSLTGKVSSGIGSSASFLSTLLATRGLGMGAQFAGAGTKIGETLAILANTSQKLGIPLNTLAESQQIKEQTKQELLDMGKNEKEAERLATNVFGVSVVATPALDAIGLFNPAIKKTLVKKMAQFGIDIGSEVAQELTQSGAQNVATGKDVFEGAKETTTVAGITSAIFSLLTKGHLSLKGEQAQPTATEPVVQADGTVTPPPEVSTTPTVGDIIANGQENYTQEEKVTAINNADFENNLVDPTNEVEAGTQEYEDLKSDIKSAVDEGANIGEIILKLREAYTVSQEYAENIVAEVIATPEATTVVEEVIKPKATPKKVVVQETVKTPTKQEILDDENVPKARKMAIEEIDYYLGASEAGRRQFTLEKDSYDYKVTAVPSTFPQFVPENMRSRKAFDRLQPYWEKQERPSNKTPMLQKLYDIFQNEVEKSVPENQKKIDEQMAQEARGDGLEFKTRKTTATREMAVLDDFKKRYKVQFPTLIVSKIIEGKKTELHPKGDGEAEGVTDGNTIALAFDAIINTGKHELIHLTLNNLDQIPELAKFSRQDILKAQAKKMGVELTKENEKTVEEQLALDFEAYQNKTYKPNNSTIAKFFASIRDMINNFRGVIVKSDGDVITQYYDAVLYGETARKQEVAITTESNVARYLIDNVLDYRPMYQTRRVLSLSNGITSVDFKTTKEVDPLLEEASKYSSADEFVKGLEEAGKIQYHGTPSQFEKFSYEFLGTQGTQEGKGFYFTDKKNIAEGYKGKSGGYLHESYVDIKKPLNYEKTTITKSQLSKFIDKLDEVERKDGGGGYLDNWGDIKSEGKQKVLNQAVNSEFDSSDNDVDIIHSLMNASGYSQNPTTFYGLLKDVLGFDGIVVKNPSWGKGQTITVAFDPEQIYNKKELSNIWNKAQETKSQPKFKDALNKSLDVYKESGDLTTKILKDLEGKTTVSKQYILDATNRGDVKQVEKDLIRNILSTDGDKINVKDFAEKVKLELLPLSTQQIINSKYEFVNLPDNVRGDVKDYKEKVYESPVQTSAGSIHFPKYAETSRRAGTDSTDKYFGHTRIEDMADKKLRRVIEVQSDLYQKGRIEQEGAQAREIKANPTYAIENRKNFTNPQAFDMINSEADKRLRDISKLEQYNDPTAHFRMIREEIRSATLDGKDVLQFPTGETAMKIEGLGDNVQFATADGEMNLRPEMLKIGKEIKQASQPWVITDVLGDGKFKAVPKNQIAEWELTSDNPKIKERVDSISETFDISGKVDTNNPIYKFYEKEVGRYLKNNYKAETVTDNNGVTWYEVKLKDEYKGAVVAFKERVTPEQNREEARKMFPRFTKAMEEKKRAQLVIPKKAELGIRSVAKRVEDRAKTLGVTVDESYEIKRFVTEVATSEVILENNKEKIEDILNGSFPYPTEVSKTAFLHTIIEDAKARNDTKTLTKAYNRLAEEATTAGQDIAFINSVYKMYDETSPETYLNKIKAERETVDTKKTWSIKNPFAGKEVREKIIRKKTERQKAIRLGVKERTTIKIQELESILDSFVC